MRTRFTALPRWTQARWALLAVCLIAVLWLRADFGMSWDEEHSANNGRYAFSWYQTLGQDQRAVTDSDQRLYGSAFNLLSVCVWRISGHDLSEWPAGFYEISHVLMALAGFVGLVCAGRIGARLAGPCAGFLSVLFLALTPAYVGHAFMNPKDAPLAVAFLVATDALLVAFSQWPAPSWKALLALGVSMGVTMGIRVNGVLLLVYWTCMVGAAFVFPQEAGGPEGARPRLVHAFRIWVLPCVVAWVVMTALWPYAQLNPLWNPIQAVLENSKFHWPASMLFEGREVESTSLPWRYLPEWLVMVLPEFVGLGLAGFLWMGASRWKRARMPLGFLLATAVAPVAYAVFRHMVLYDGMRHFLFVVPPFVVFSACGAACACEKIGGPSRGVSRWAAGALTLAIAASLVTTLTDMRQLHPYEYIFVNRVVAGGQVAASTQFETDYWGLSVHEGLAWLKANPLTGGGRITVDSCAHPAQLRYPLEQDLVLASRFVPMARGIPPGVYLALTRWNCHKSHSGTLLHVVERKGVPLLYILDVRKP